MDRAHNQDLDAIAIIGLAGRFPGARNPDEFWTNLREGVESVSSFSPIELERSGVSPHLLADPNYVRAGAILEDIDRFDADFFGMNAREAEMMDPQQRIFLECSWEALENAGYDPGRFRGRIAVCAGAGPNTYLLSNLLTRPDMIDMVGIDQVKMANRQDHLATRVAYKVGLRGPSFTVQTTCSTSLVAVHLACQSLLAYQCEMALAGGVTITVPQAAGYLYRPGGVLSPDGHCRAFDARAAGMITGNGAGVVVLKRLADALEDGDFIRAVIKGSAINNDGSLKIGYTAPSVSGQAEVIAEALALAECDAETISYVEAHGTGTVLGDPIEIAALTQAFRLSSTKHGYCAIGSVKTNIGHLDAAAGVAGLIKTVLALENKELPPSLHFEHPNPKIDFASSPFYVNTTLCDWKSYRTPRRAGVSSFGIGGTNAHVVLEEAPPVEQSDTRRPCHLVVLSAQSAPALDEATTRTIEYMKSHPHLNLADLAYTSAVGRRAFSYRRMAVCHALDEAAHSLETLNAARVFTASGETGSCPIVFMFPGQGAQHSQMASELYRVEPDFRAQVDLCSALLEPYLGRDLRHLLYSRDGDVDAMQLEQTAIAQPALFVIEYALAKLLMGWGVRPHTMVGHSLGEYVAACLAGVFTLADALALVAIRGRLMQQMPPGGMLAIPLPTEEVEPLLNDDLALASVNGPSLSVVSGPLNAIERLQDLLATRGITCRRLHTSHAFHSRMMDPIVRPFEQQLDKIAKRPPVIPYLSNVTGTWTTATNAMSSGYWSRQLCETVQFAPALGEVLKEPRTVLLEVGPGQTLSTLARKHPDRTAGHLVLRSLCHVHDRESDMEILLTSLGRLWLSGGEVDWEAFHASERRHRIPLPTYPFQRKRYWIEPGKRNPSPDPIPGHNRVEVPDAPDDPAVTQPQRAEWHTPYRPPGNRIERIIADIWQKLLGVERIGIDDNFFELRGDSLLGVQLVSQLRDTFSVDFHLHSISEAQTVADQASLIEARLGSGCPEPARIFTPLVEIQPHGSRPPLFFVHPAGGGVLCYAQLARCLGPDQPLLGLEATGLTGEEEPHVRIEDMAAYYLEAVQGRQPEGPYLLGGWSMGGNIAFEMALQLERQGFEVAMLALCDSHPPACYTTASDEARFLAAFLWTAALHGEKTPDVSYDQLRRLEPGQHVRYVLERMRRENLMPADIDDMAAQRLFRMWTLHHRCLQTYTPQQLFTGRITFFRAEEKTPDELLHLVGLDLQHGIDMEGWSNLSTGPLEVHHMPGSHHTMLNQPHVQTLSARLRHCLDGMR